MLLDFCSVLKIGFDDRPRTEFHALRGSVGPVIMRQLKSNHAYRVIHLRIYQSKWLIILFYPRKFARVDFVGTLLACIDLSPAYSCFPNLFESVVC